MPNDIIARRSWPRRRLRIGSRPGERSSSKGSTTGTRRETFPISELGESMHVIRTRDVYASAVSSAYNPCNCARLFLSASSSRLPILFAVGPYAFPRPRRPPHRRHLLRLVFLVSPSARDKESTQAALVRWSGKALETRCRYYKPHERPTERERGEGECTVCQNSDLSGDDIKTVFPAEF